MIQQKKYDEFKSAYMRLLMESKKDADDVDQSEDLDLSLGDSDGSGEADNLKSSKKSAGRASGTDDNEDLSLDLDSDDEGIDDEEIGDDEAGANDNEDLSLDLDSDDEEETDEVKSSQMDDLDQDQSQDQSKSSDEDEEGSSKLVSFSVQDSQIQEALQRVKSGQLKLVAVPVDYKFSQGDAQEGSQKSLDIFQIDVDKLQSFEIQDLSEDASSEIDQLQSFTWSDSQDGQDESFEEDDDQVYDVDSDQGLEDDGQIQEGDGQDDGQIQDSDGKEADDQEGDDQQDSSDEDEDEDESQIKKQSRGCGSVRRMSRTFPY